MVKTDDGLRRMSNPLPCGPADCLILQECPIKRTTGGSLSSFSKPTSYPAII